MDSTSVDATEENISQLESLTINEVDSVSVEEQNAQRPPLPSRSNYTVREIYKNSWIKRIPSIEKKPGRFTKIPKPEKQWMVFCVHNDKEPLLEFYDNRRSAYSHNPTMSISLINCLHISPSIYPQEENDHEFVITLGTEILRIAASSREQMIEWMDTLKVKLREMSILEPKDNVYSREPGTPKLECIPQQQLTPTQQTEDQIQHNERDYQHIRHSEPVQSTNTRSVNENSVAVNSSPHSNNVIPTVVTQEGQGASNAAVSSTSNIFNFDFVSSNLYENAAVQNLEIDSNQDDCFSESLPVLNNRALSLPTSPITSESDSLYEPLFFVNASSPSQTFTSRGIRNPNYENPSVVQQRRSESEVSSKSSVPLARSSVSSMSEVTGHHSQYTPSPDMTSRRLRTLRDAVSVSEPSLNVPLTPNNIAPSRRISVGSLPENRQSGQNNLNRTSQSAHNQEQSRSQSTRTEAPLPLEEGPPPYDGLFYNQCQNMQGTNVENSFLDENGRPLSLKETQVRKLQKEITHKSGVRLMLRKKDCVNTIAFVDCFGAVWVAGWKQKEHPLLHNTFHIGDCIISIAGHRIHNVQEAQKAIKHQPLIVEFVVHRVPHGCVLAIKRQYDGQDLGLIREGNTAEIKEVKPDGLAFKHGLPAKAPTVDGSGSCNWVLTEINHRPLNLFFKDNEISDRLNAVGRDISILVQPVDLVKQLKKHLKLLRGYKDYIVQ
ncbi:uncharacterized protein LOC111612707 [Centruroides sculpturatus]|uniref:uncharacterized protein LOC111612707 n=1 Tax=Centruroides sculpturatus TaxID=218467 RepID=UPI000C6E3ADA|nr:uncharacterized protein LOC111612707 [Centruroides sculpturatus]